MARTKHFAFGTAALFTLAACGDKVETSPDAGTDPSILGQTTVDLELQENPGTRSTETLIGNLVANAFLERFASQGVQVAFENGGSLRCPDEFDAAKCVGYKIPAGPITQAQLETVLKFDAELVIKDVTGAVLKSTLERAVYSIPSRPKGWFLHPAGLRFTADCSRAAQETNTDGTVLVTEGDRVTSITINGQALDPAATYKIAIGAFEGSGKDGHVQLGAVPAQTTGIKEREIVADYIKKHSPVTPALDGRITLSNCE